MMKRIIISCNHEPRKHSGVTKTLGKSKRQLCIFVAYDSVREILSQMASKGLITAQELDGLLGRYNDTQLCDVQILLRTIRILLK